MSLNVACGRCRFLSRNQPGPWLSVKTSRSDPRIAAIAPLLPPEQANTAPLNEPTRSTSCVRADRIGPTLGASLLWKIVANRVGPAPHASNTMSAESRPDWGRAPGSLEILTTTAGRAASAGSTMGSPVNGMTGSGAIVVDVLLDDDDDVDDDDVLDASVEVVGLALMTDGDVSATLLAGAAPAPLQATSPNATSRIGVVLENLTVLSGVRCALRAGDGCRTCDSSGRTCRRRPRLTMAARSTDVRSQL